MKCIAAAKAAWTKKAFGHKQRDENLTTEPHELWKSFIHVKLKASYDKYMQEAVRSY